MTSEDDLSYLDAARRMWEESGKPPLSGVAERIRVVGVRPGDLVVIVAGPAITTDEAAAYMHVGVSEILKESCPGVAVLVLPHGSDVTTALRMDPGGVGPPAVEPLSQEVIDQAARKE